MTAIHTATIAAQAYSAAFAAGAAERERARAPMEAGPRIVQRSGGAPERRPLAELRPVAQEEGPRAGERPSQAQEARSDAERRAGTSLPYSVGFLAQIIAQGLRPLEQLRLDTTPHEGFAAYRFATDQGVAYFGILDPVDFTV